MEDRAMPGPNGQSTPGEGAGEASGGYSRRTRAAAPWLLIGILGVLSGAVLERWQPLAPRPAQAVENPAENRLEMINELRKITERLDRLVGLFEGGKVKIVVANPEDIRPSDAAVKPAAQQGGGANENAEESKFIIKRKVE